VEFVSAQQCLYKHVPSLEAGKEGKSILLCGGFSPTVSNPSPKSIHNICRLNRITR
jgi:hypothetical protein